VGRGKTTTKKVIGGSRCPGREDSCPTVGEEDNHSLHYRGEGIGTKKAGEKEGERGGKGDA